MQSSGGMELFHRKPSIFHEAPRVAINYAHAIRAHDHDRCAHDDYRFFCAHDFIVSLVIRNASHLPSNLYII